MNKNSTTDFLTFFENKSYNLSYSVVEEDNHVLITVTHVNEDLVSELPEKFQFTVDKLNNVTVIGLNSSQLIRNVVEKIQH